MPDPSPDTPNVCPTCGSNDRNRFPIGAGCLSDLGHHPWHDSPITPAAPGSSPRCCLYGAAMSGEYPEFVCEECPRHGEPHTGHRCRRHGR